MPSNRPDTSPQRGFTLIEVMVVMSIMVVLAGVAVPSFAWFNQTTRIRAAAFDLVADLDFARSEAIKRNADVVVAPAGSWNDGWTVSAGGNVIRARGALGGQVTFDTQPGELTYNSAGRLTGGAVTSFQICPPSRGTLSGRTIRVDPSGLSRSTKTTCAAT